MKLDLKVIESGIQNRLNAMLTKAKNPAVYLQRQVLPQYVAAQAKRWQNENVGDDYMGGRWAELNPTYRIAKRKRFAAFPGGGTKKLIATNRLVEGVLGRSEDSRKMIQGSKLLVAVSIPYAKHVDEERTFSKFSRAWYKKILIDYKRWIASDS